MINAKTEKINGRFGAFDALVISGDTRPVKDDLKALGFQWFPQKAVWWKVSKNVDERTITKLKTLGVEFGESNIQAPQSPLTPNELQETQHAQEVPVAKKQWVTEDEEMSKWYKFPINKNIQSYETTTNVDGKDYNVNISIDRSYVMGGDIYTKRKSREYIKRPRYVINVTIPEFKAEDNQPYKKSYNYTVKQPIEWATYDEDAFLNTNVKDITQKILSQPDKIPGIIKYKVEISKRTPEYKQFLNDIGESKIKPTFSFHIDQAPYTGDYKIEVDDLGCKENALTVYLNTLVEKEGAPSQATVAYKAPLDGTYTVEDFNKKINEYLISDHAEIEKNYVKYLKSFPYLDSQKEEANQSINEIKNILANPQASVNKVFDELKNRGYIRPHKRQKQWSGLTRGEEITWIIDSKKIVRDAYSYGSYLSHTPDYFYAVVAYYIHRQARNITSWTDMMLVDSMNIWRRSMEKFGVTLSLKEIDHIVSVIGNEIYGTFKKNVEPEEEQINSNVSGILKDFADLAQKHGISTVGIEDNVKDIYRSLVKNLHPDRYQDPIEKQQKTREFQDLQNIYDAIPAQYKAASSWYGKYIESEALKTIIISSIKKDIKI